MGSTTKLHPGTEAQLAKACKDIAAKTGGRSLDLLGKAICTNLDKNLTLRLADDLKRKGKKANKAAQKRRGVDTVPDLKVHAIPINGDRTKGMFKDFSKPKKRISWTLPIYDARWGKIDVTFSRGIGKQGDNLLFVDVSGRHDLLK